MSAGSRWKRTSRPFLPASHPGSKVVVGDGPALGRLRDACPEVHFLGRKSGADLAACYAGADVFVFPSRTDTFGLVMIEALACGTPVAAYPVLRAARRARSRARARWTEGSRRRDRRGARARPLGLPRPGARLHLAGEHRPVPRRARTGFRPADPRGRHRRLPDARILAARRLMAYIVSTSGRSERGGPFISTGEISWPSPLPSCRTRPLPGWSTTPRSASSRSPNSAVCTSSKCRRWPTISPAPNIPGAIPVHSGELTHGEIERGQADPNYSLKMQQAPVDVSRTKGPRYTPVSKRQDKPDGIAWIIRNHPEISDAQIGQADRHHAQHDQRHSRAHALEHPEHPAQGSGDARPVLAARARCGGRQGGQDAHPSPSRARKRRPSRSIRATTARADRGTEAPSAKPRSRRPPKRRRRRRPRPGSRPSAPPKQSGSPA